MTASSLISSFGSTVTITRYAAGSYVNGSYVAGATSSISATMSVQPMNGRDLLLLPEGQRTRNFLKGYSSVVVYTADQAASKKADVVTVGSKNYEVHSVQEWLDQGSSIDPFWKITLAEIEV